MQLALIFVALFGVVAAFPQGSKQYPIKLQPELDNINIEDYLKNDKLLSLQIKCVVHDGPCDSVGRWLKPRIPGAILGQCAECTPKQAIGMQKILAYMQEKRPEEYRASVAKFVNEALGSSTTAASA